MGSPEMLKKTPVKTSLGTRASAVEVLVRVTTRWPDASMSNVTEALREPFESVKVMGMAPARVGVIAAATMTARTKRMFILLMSISQLRYARIMPYDL